MRRCLISLIIPLLLASCSQNTHWIITPPAGDEYTLVNKDSVTVTPNGRHLTPAGKYIMVAPHPYGLALSSDGSLAVTANSGISPFSISLIHEPMSEHPEVMQVPEGLETNKGILAAVFMGLSITRDNKLVYVAGGQQNKIFLFNTTSGAQEGEISCRDESSEGQFNDGYLGDMKSSSDGNFLYVVDQINFCIDVIDTRLGKLVSRVPTGRYPFGICLSPDEKKLYVANVGMYQYSLVKSLDEKNLKKTSLSWPAYGYGTKESVEGVKNDSMEVAGLGDPNVPESFSVWSYNLEKRNNPSLQGKIKTGILVGQMVEGVPAVGGSSPNSLVATDRYVFVSNGNNDCISVIDPMKDKVVTSISLQPDPRLKALRGIIPFGMAVSPDQKTLFVAEAGLNAVAMINIASMKVEGHIPTPWFPAKIQVSPDGKKMLVACSKGFGSGPNGGNNIDLPGRKAYIGYLMRGAVSVIDIPSTSELKKYTQQVLDNNFCIREATASAFQDRSSNPVPLYPGEKESPIKHIVFISKENRTYDEVFGQLAKGKGDPSLARYGLGVTFANRVGTMVVEKADVMVNHMRLAQQFAISDNFYVDADVSADGHHWLTCTYPNEWVETSVPASYGGGRNLYLHSKSPGIFAFTGASGSYFPEDYNEAGSMWDHFFRHGISYYNFGFSVEMAPSYADSTMKYTGIRYMINYPLPGHVYDHSSRTFATFNMNIPDQFRENMFEKEFREKWLSGKETMPQVLTVQLPNDHGAGERPWAGFPFKESYMCDNDLAVGRIVEFLSHTPYWKSMAIIITEDDAQDGRDHIDAHRSILMVISPWVKRDFVSHTHLSFGSIFKTFWNILGTPYLNQFDATAADLADLFTDEPDFTPYSAVAVDARVFEPQKALDPMDARFSWKEAAESPVLDNPDDMMSDGEEEEEE